MSDEDEMNRVIDMDLPSGEHIMRSHPGTRAVGEPTFNYLSVTFGRNVGTEPMSDAVWQCFQADILYDTRENVARPYFVADLKFGTSEWAGAREESAVWTFVTETPFTLGTVENLKRALRDVATEYEQDAIAVAYGTSVLVERTSRG